MRFGLLLLLLGAIVSHTDRAEASTRGAERYIERNMSDSTEYARAKCAPPSGRRYVCDVTMFGKQAPFRITAWDATVRQYGNGYYLTRFKRQ